MPRLVLVGGGHAHVEVLRRVARERMPAEVVLIDPYAELPYSGMVPGFIAGLYRRSEIIIDLKQLCARAGVTFRRSRVCQLDAASRQLLCDDGEALSYDFVSLDVGSTLDRAVPGATEHALAVRPLHRFIDSWPAVAARASRVAVVGAGAAGLELALALNRSLARRGSEPRVTVIGDAPRIAPALPEGARALIERTCAARGIALHLGSPVQQVKAEGVTLENGMFVAADCVVWATGPVAHPWLRASGLPVNDGGFVRIDEHLRVTPCSGVFAAGDVATMTGHPHPKSGVYAVRAAPVLADNLRRALMQQPLRQYAPQRRALALIGTADGQAVGVYGGVSAHGRWLWWWKDRIDRRFVRRYEPAAPASGS